MGDRPERARLVKDTDMKKQTIIDVFKEMGTHGELLLLLFLALLVYGAIIHFRKLDQHWRKSFLIASFLPMTAGFFFSCHFLIDMIGMIGNSAVGTGAPSHPLMILNEGILVMVRFSAWLTIILLVFSAFLFITGKKDEVIREGEEVVPTADDGGAP